MTEIKQMAKSPRAKPAETVSTWEPAQSHVETVTEKKGKDQKRWRTTAQKRLIEQLQAAKESLRPGDGTSAPPKEADRERTDKRPEHNFNWIPWIIVACLARGSLAYISRNMHLRASSMSVAAGPVPKVQDKSLLLKACPDAHYME